MPPVRAGGQNVTVPAFVFFKTVNQILIPALNSLQELTGPDVKVLRKLYRELVHREEGGGARALRRAPGRVLTRPANELVAITHPNPRNVVT